MKKIPHLDCDQCKTRHKSLFSDLGQEQLCSLSEKKVCNIYKKGQAIFYEGNQPTGIYCINKGQIKVYKTGKIGKEQIVRMAKDGDVLGYRSLLEGSSYSATAEAIEDSTICFIDKKCFMETLEDNAGLSLKVIQLLSQALGEAENFIQSLAQKSVRERLAESLLLLKAKYGVDPEDKTLLAITLTREDIANLVGTATETAIRLISEFKEEGLISFEGKRLRFINIKKLADVAGID